MNNNLKNKIIKCLVKTFNIFPIKKNKVFIFSYYGSQYGCNPKYISEYINQNDDDKNFDIVWAFNDMKKQETLKGGRAVKTMSLKYFYEMCTSKIIITNFRTTDFFIKRKNQYYIQTWHSSLRLKQIEKDTQNTLPLDYVEMAKNDSKKIDLLISGCRYSTEIFKRAFWYDGEILECGSPRNDILFNTKIDLNRNIRSKLGIKDKKKIILYAPTFRKNNSLDAYNLNYENIKNSIEKKFGDEWIVLLKLHPHVAAKSQELISGADILDVSYYDDMQELLKVTDFLVSDYSSLIFDYLLTKKPCLLYTPDLTDYIDNDRNLYFDVKELPFLLAINNKEVSIQIEKFDEVNYHEKTNNFLEKMGNCDIGKSNEEIYKIIKKVCG